MLVFSLLSRSGIGYIFRDHEGNVLLKFDKQIHVDSTIHGELLAVRKGLLTATTFRWTNSSFFIFKVDFQTIIAQLSDHSDALWRFYNTI